MEFVVNLNLEMLLGKLVTYGGFNLHFHNGQQCWVCFICLLTVYISSLCKSSIQVFFSFLMSCLLFVIIYKSSLYGFNTSWMLLSLSMHCPFIFLTSFGEQMFLILMKFCLLSISFIFSDVYVLSNLSTSV